MENNKNLQELRTIVARISKQGKMLFLEGATEEEISAFEKKNDVLFPKKYREWLLFSDGGECFLPAGVQFYGVAHKPLIDVDDNSRPNNNYIVIGALANGDPVLCMKDCEQISLFNQEKCRIEDDEIYEDFYAFLNDLYALLGIGG